VVDAEACKQAWWYVSPVTGKYDGMKGDDHSFCLYALRQRDSFLRQFVLLYLNIRKGSGRNPDWNRWLNYGRPMGLKGRMQHRVPFWWVGFTVFPEECGYHNFSEDSDTVDMLETSCYFAVPQNQRYMPGIVGFERFIFRALTIIYFPSRLIELDENIAN
jgi:hypothetical protein